MELSMKTSNEKSSKGSNAKSIIAAPIKATMSPMLHPVGLKKPVYSPSPVKNSPARNRSKQRKTPIENTAGSK